MKPAPVQARHAGFTLIEVLVALTLVAIALGAGVKAAGALTDNAQRLSEVSAAQWCIENQLTELRLTHQFPDLGTLVLPCTQLGQNYPGELRISPTPNPLFRRVDARIHNAAGQVVLQMSTIVGRY